MAVIPWENSREIESGNKGERFGAAGGREGGRGGERATLSRLLREGRVRTRCSPFLREESDLSLTGMSGLLSRNLSCKPTEKRTQTDRRTE